MVMSNYPQSFRSEVLEFLKKNNLTQIETAKHFGISSITVFRWVHKPIIGQKAKAPNVVIHNKRCRTSKMDMAALKANIQEHPDWSLIKRAKWFKVSKGCIWGALSRLNAKRIERKDWKLGMSPFIYVIED
jgi:transposase